MAVHAVVSRQEPAAPTHSYWIFLGMVLAVSVFLSLLQRWSNGLRRWMGHMCPIIAAAFVLLTLWAVITSGFRLLPLPYFPSPAWILQSMIEDRAMLFDSTWHSLLLLLSLDTLALRLMKRDSSQIR